MDTKVAKSFSDAFDCENQKHVVWWKLLVDTMEMEEGRVDGAKVLRVIQSNPMGTEFTEKNMLDLVFIQFSLGLKYARAVLDGKAWFPQSPKTPGE